MRRLKRYIEVFEQDNVRVEVEGNTVSIQVVDPQKPQNVWKGVLPRPICCTLSVVLNSALALEGGPVVEQAIVVKPADGRCTKHGYVDCLACNSPGDSGDDDDLDG